MAKVIGGCPDDHATNEVLLLLEIEEVSMLCEMLEGDVEGLAKYAIGAGPNMPADKQQEYASKRHLLQLCWSIIGRSLPSICRLELGLIELLTEEELVELCNRDIRGIFVGHPDIFPRYPQEHIQMKALAEFFLAVKRGEIDIDADDRVRGEFDPRIFTDPVRQMSNALRYGPRS